jgi:hypothetical protein
LRDLDFAAHSGVFGQDSFKKTVPEMASRFANRLVVALGPILRWETEQNNESLRQQLCGIFCDALAVKTFAIESKKLPECVWPSLGTPFDTAIMATEEVPAYADDVERYPSKTVQLVLVPGLRLYEYDKQTVDCFGFKREHQQCTGSYRTLRKAVVLLD